MPLADMIRSFTGFEEMPEGYFTIVYPLHNTHRTLRLRRQDADDVFMPGCLIVSKMTGSDNESHYSGIGHIKNGILTVWKKAAQDQQTVNAIVSALNKIRVNTEETGKAYAMRSGKCWVCNRLLTNPESIQAGIGPECRKKI